MMDSSSSPHPMMPGNETVYGTHEDTNMVMSEKVQSLAGSIYQEFERMIQQYDEDVVKTLMPLLVNVLECLDSAYQTNQEQDVELELLREDNEQLVTQYEREKAARKQAEQKLLETEDIADAENKELVNRMESLESIVRMLELKHKNSLDHASRLEEREADFKKEYSKLHDRYTELFKTHVDYMERTKMMMGSTHSQMSSTSERVDLSKPKSNQIMFRSSGPVSYGFASLDHSGMLDTETICSPGDSTDGSGPPSLQNELENLKDESPVEEKVIPPQPIAGRSTTHKEQRSANTLYQELSFQDNEESEEHEVTGSWVHPGEYASSVNDNFYGMGKEVEKLISENTELLATKNALNIVKDDLIVKVDELTGEVEILREELNASKMARHKLNDKISELDDELKKMKEQAKHHSNNEQDEEGDVPLAQRKKFTRVEMARVLMERNQYKERFMELQEAVRWTEMIRASKTVEMDKKTKQGIWKFFSKLFSTTDRNQDEPPGPLLRYNSSGHYTAPEASEGRLAITSSGDAPHTSGQFFGAGSKDYDDNSERALQRRDQSRRDQFRKVRVHVQKEDGRVFAYGWSLPGTKPEKVEQKPSNVKVPVPVYCKPLAAASPHMKVFCAAGVNLNGGFTRDGGCLIGGSIFYAKETAQLTEITSPTTEVGHNELDSLDHQINMVIDNTDLDTQLSSYVWICTSTHSASTVTVIDAKTPDEVLDSFPVCQTHLLCICSVMGALEKDYAILENSEVIKAGESLEKPGEGPNEMGKVEFIRISAGEIKLTNEMVVPASQDEISPSDIKVEVKSEKSVITSADKDGKMVSSCNLADEDPQPNVPISVAGNNANALSNLPFMKPQNPILGSTNPSEEPAMTSVGPTMWLGAQNGMLYVHSSIGRWRECLHKICLPDAVLSIVHVQCCVVAALANGKLAIFRRQTDGQWDLNSYHLVTLGQPQHSVRCLCIVGDKIWAAHLNKIYVIDPISLNIMHILEAHPRKECQIRQMVATGLGVWVSIRLDSTLRLYHAQTYEHLQDVDIEPYVSKMLGTGKLGFSFVRITALLVSYNRLWIGTGNGVVISVPLTNASSNGAPGSLKNYIPRCFMANAQLSFHGHRDAVKFFVSVPVENLPRKLNKKPEMRVISGGEGYIDFRQGDGDMDNSIVLEANQTIENRGDKSYLIIWEVGHP